MMLDVLRDSPSGTEGYWVFYRDGSVGHFRDETSIIKALNSSSRYLDTVLSVLKGTKVRLVGESQVVIKAIEEGKG